MTHESVDRRIVRIASRQHGIFTRDDVLAAGGYDALISRRVAQGLWIRVHPGVYRLAGAPRTWLQSLLAAVLYGGPGAVASHRAAGALHELPDLPPRVLEITVARPRRIRARGIIVHQTSDLVAADRVIVRGIPVTSPARTLIDLAGRTTEDVLEELLDDALRRGRTTVPRLRKRIRELRNSGRKGIVVIDALCAAREGDAASESILETRFERILIRGGIPKPVRQYEVGIGSRDYYFDFAYPDQGVAIEVDGYASRASRQRWERELARQNDILGAGWLLLRFTSTDIEKRPGDIVRKVARALARRRPA